MSSRPSFRRPKFAQKAQHLAPKRSGLNIEGLSLQRRASSSSAYETHCSRAGHSSSDSESIVILDRCLTAIWPSDSAGSQRAWYSGYAPCRDGNSTHRGTGWWRPKLQFTVGNITTRGPLRSSCLCPYHLVLIPGITSISGKMIIVNDEGSRQVNGRRCKDMPPSGQSFSVDTFEPKSGPNTQHESKRSHLRKQSLRTDHLRCRVRRDAAIPAEGADLRESRLRCLKVNVWITDVAIQTQIVMLWIGMNGEVTRQDEDLCQSMRLKAMFSFVHHRQV